MHRRLPAALMLALVLVATVAWPAPAQSSQRLVLAFYYNWFGEKDWSSGRMADVPATPYVSSDRGAMGRQIDQAKGAGIDAFVVNWWGPQDNNQTEANLRALLDEAGARGFHVAVDMDMNSPYFGGAGAIQTAMSHLLGMHAQHGAYLRVDGKPVVFFYHQGARLGTAGWAALRAATDPNHGSLWIEEGLDVSPLSVFDGHHLYSVTWPSRTDMGYTANKFARLVRAKAAEIGAPKIYVSTVMPGYNDIPNRGGFAIDREGGAYYERSWQGAIGAAPDWVVINSFNEWFEGDQIEPSRAFGNQYLDLTAKWAAAFRSGAAPAPPPAPTQALPAAAVQAPQPVAVQVAPTPRPVLPTPIPPPVIDPLTQRRYDRVR